MSKKITTSVQSEGFEAVLYPGDGRKDKVMIVMSGSNGGMTFTKQEAEFYHKNGIMVSMNVLRNWLPALMTF